MAAPLQTLVLDPGVEPAASIVILHGLGADGTDFLPVADQLELAPIGPVRYLFPRAPERAVTINNGYRMRAWYDILGTDLPRREDEAGLRESFAQVHALLAQEIARGVPAHRIVLAGFSQGCAITLGAGLRFGARLAGLAGMSGYLPLAGHTEAERLAANTGTPIFLAHGSRDDIVPVAAGRASRDHLLALGHAVQWHEYPMEHSVCMDEVQELQRWLLATLRPA
jgi:phospholipase/carboxylesterase